MIPGKPTVGAYPASVRQYTIWRNRGMPALERIREGIWALPLPMPNTYHPYSFSYLLEDANSGIHVIDLGWPSTENERLFHDALETIGRSLSDVASITGTHLHPDHLGFAETLRKASGAPLILYGDHEKAAARTTGESWAGLHENLLDQWAVPTEWRGELAIRDGQNLVPLQADILIGDGERLPVPGRRLLAIHTPGHTPDHICIHDLDEDLIFTGDHLLPNIRPGLGLGGPSGTNPISDYLRSLARVASLGVDEGAPGHEYRFTGLKQRCSDVAGHHLNRSREVTALLGSGERSVWEVASQISWTPGWSRLRGFYLQSALSQTALHIDFVRSEQSQNWLGSHP